MIPICFTTWIIAQLHFELVIYRLGMKQNKVIAGQSRLGSASTIEGGVTAASSRSSETDAGEKSRHRVECSSASCRSR